MKEGMKSFMIKEIEQMMERRATASDSEKNAIDEAIRNIASTFREMLKNARIAVLTGEEKQVDLEKAKEAMKIIFNSAEQEWSDEEAKTFVLKFGNDIIVSKFN